MKDEGPDGHMHANEEPSKDLGEHVTAPYLRPEDDGPIGHMCMEEKSPKSRRILAPHEAHESTNLLLGLLCGHVENLVIESNRANRGADLRHEEWQEALITMGAMQATAHKTGAKVIMVGICLMSTIISVVISLLI